MKTELLRVKQRGLRSIEVERTISIEIPAGISNLAEIEAIIHEQAKRSRQYFEPVAGTEKVTLGDLKVVGNRARCAADGPADIPLRMEVGR
jgi:hypothetical protein